MKEGDRIGAVLSAKDGKVKFIGYGTYEGRHVPPDTIGGFNLGLPNPKLKMDDGTIVWGCECWWGPENIMMEKIVKYDMVIQVNMEEERLR